MRHVALSDILNAAASAKESGDFKKLLAAQCDLRQCISIERRPELFIIIASKLLEHSETLTQHPDYAEAGLDGCMHLAHDANFFDNADITELKYKAVDIVFGYVETHTQEPLDLKRLYLYFIHNGRSETKQKATDAYMALPEEGDNDFYTSGPQLKLNA